MQDIGDCVKLALPAFKIFKIGSQELFTCYRNFAEFIKENIDDLNDLEWNKFNIKLNGDGEPNLSSNEIKAVRNRYYSSGTFQGNVQIGSNQHKIVYSFKFGGYQLYNDCGDLFQGQFNEEDQRDGVGIYYCRSNNTHVYGMWRSGKLETAYSSPTINTHYSNNIKETFRIRKGPNPVWISNDETKPSVSETNEATVIVANEDTNDENRPIDNETKEATMKLDQATEPIKIIESRYLHRLYIEIFENLKKLGTGINFCDYLDTMMNGDNALKKLLDPLEEYNCDHLVPREFRVVLNQIVTNLSKQKIDLLTQNVSNLINTIGTYFCGDNRPTSPYCWLDDLQASVVDTPYNTKAILGCLAVSIWKSQQEINDKQDVDLYKFYRGSKPCAFVDDSNMHTNMGYLIQFQVLNDILYFLTLDGKGVHFDNSNILVESDGKNESILSKIKRLQGPRYYMYMFEKGVDSDANFRVRLGTCIGNKNQH